jgi:hypothetical protein
MKRGEIVREMRRDFRGQSAGKSRKYVGGLLPALCDFVIALSWTTGRRDAIFRSMIDRATLEVCACNLRKVEASDFNANAQIPCGVTTGHMQAAMNEFVDFLGFINTQLATRKISRLETMLMAANFSSMVGEFVAAALPKYCPTVARNKFHNGHPDLVPTGRFPGDSVHYHHEGIEVKASRYLKDWQGHNAEDSWLMVLCFEGNRQKDDVNGISPMPFRFLKVCGAQLTKDDWKFAGRSATSRRTITASVTKSGYAKMMSNWIYIAPGL